MSPLFGESIREVNSNPLVPWRVGRRLMERKVGIIMSATLRHCERNTY